MRRAELEHILRAAGAISAEREIIVIGSQAILGSYADPPPELLVSLEADVYPAANPAKAALIDGSIGELSPFHDTFGYFAHGVGPETARLAPGWEGRLVPLSNENTHGVTGLCLSVVDLAISKLAAGRPKDLDYVKILLAHGLVRKDEILSLIGPLEEAERIRATLQRLDSRR
ncbi:MAG: hypothetical protein KF760_27030 [Candidatus Eremiobacteraeota bacterium]|nr:hypothetical protein [Candidatus Eremiobacteraeota bacterium]MCW5869606.1 hypothetical protein [Candidatus Eremiobacteraeota bacterium]